MSDFLNYNIPPGKRWEVTGALAHCARSSGIRCSFNGDGNKESFSFSEEGEGRRRFPQINDGLCEGSWYRQVLQGPPLYTQLPDYTHTRLHVFAWQVSLCRVLKAVLTMFNRLILALYNQTWINTVTNVLSMGETTRRYIKVNFTWGHFKCSQQTSSRWSRNWAWAWLEHSFDPMQISAATVRLCTVCKVFLLFTSLKTEAPLFSVTPQPRRWWWDELVAKIGALSVCVTHKHTVEESDSLAVFLSWMVSSVLNCCTQSYKESKCQSDWILTQTGGENSPSELGRQWKLCKPRGGNRSASYSLFVCS